MSKSDAEREASEAEIGRYDEGDNVCTGCGRMIDTGRWCHSCTYGQ